jgi:hypothetical protein
MKINEGHTYRTRGGKTAEVIISIENMWAGAARGVIVEMGVEVEWFIDGKFKAREIHDFDLMEDLGPTKAPAKEEGLKIQTGHSYKTRGKLIAEVIEFYERTSLFVGVVKDTYGRSIDPDVTWYEGGAYWDGLRHSFDLVEDLGPTPQPQTTPKDDSSLEALLDEAKDYMQKLEAFSKAKQELEEAFEQGKKTLNLHGSYSVTTELDHYYYLAIGKKLLENK